MKKTTDENAKLSLKQLQDAKAVRVWRTATEEWVEKALMKGTSKAATDVSSAQKAGCEALLEDTLATVLKLEQKGFLRNFVDAGDDDFDLERRWAEKPRIATVVIAPLEKLGDRLERLAKKLVKEGLGFLCRSVLSMEPEAVEKQATQEQLTRIVNTKLSMGEAEVMRAEVVRYVTVRAVRQTRTVAADDKSAECAAA